MKWSVSPDGRFFRKDGKAVFYLGDTVWNAFSGAELEEWEDYLEVRRRQGYNVLQISVLPIMHDGSGLLEGRCPFALQEDDSLNFAEPNPAYFRQAARMVEMAFARGMTCALVLLWGEYVPGTWMSRQNGASSIMPREHVASYVGLAVRTFSPYDPLYYISGDTNFETEEAADYYLHALEMLKRVAPEALASLHVCGRLAALPERLDRHPGLDFYAYQSGHSLADQPDAYGLAMSFAARPNGRPVVNAEPCYEGHGHHGAYGRFDAFAVRRAFWSSVLSGASAGFAYGAHGLWSWHRRGRRFTKAHASQVPFDWRTALRLPGASDVALGAWLMERHEMLGCRPAQELLIDAPSGIRAAVSRDGNTLMAYVPYSHAVHLRLAPDAFAFELFDLEIRCPMRPVVHRTDDGVVIEMEEVNSDVLVIGRAHF